MVSESKVKEVPFTEPLVVFLLAQSRDGAACPVALNREPTQLSVWVLACSASHFSRGSSSCVSGVHSLHFLTSSVMNNWIFPFH